MNRSGSFESIKGQYELLAYRALNAQADSLFVLNLQEDRIIWTDSQLTQIAAPAFASDLAGIVATMIRLAAEDRLPVPMKAANAIVLQARELKSVTNAGPPLGACRVRFALPSRGSDSLSRQEQHVAQLLARGYEVVNVAAVTGISEHTVRTYVRRIYRKLRVHNRAELVNALVA
jgi:DNA-binding NarL/FixJ family response regulator